VTSSGTSGGSGIVVVRFSSVLTPTIGAGLSYTTSFDATTGDKLIRFTAGTDTVSFS
jgi:outer membrane protein W